ncbi:hypothetical protein PPL_08941 [Heterostelium album PN500]|uniref:Uncharacterized protein n=1 Tax=Heterostelium pallidum (strain ATCC 26659 / Pp 5 / PN500) TaxID=670386 RepID=D3BK60_HETP5|nr:hypothetical protein PPL_08941 [Heterostelium album PN500]EFA78290.1 hypothetical protein PPL_08941 [Heterostelium album PN500]|eukprot:XP_020430415.1 hypothetical protein PPL_08941 [Heterostelium album PN500]
MKINSRIRHSSENEKRMAVAIAPPDSGVVADVDPAMECLIEVIDERVCILVFASDIQRLVVVEQAVVARLIVESDGAVVARGVGACRTGIGWCRFGRSAVVKRNFQMKSDVCLLVVVVVGDGCCLVFLYFLHLSKLIA